MHSSQRGPCLTKIGLLSMVCFVRGLQAAQGADTEALSRFEGTIRPILAEHCFACHGPEKQESDLRVDHLALLLKGGERGPAIVAGAPEKSRLVTAVGYDDDELQMPPKKKLAPEQITALTQWIKEGAIWPDEQVKPLAATETKRVPVFDLAQRRAAHWAWKPVRPLAPPQVQDAAWNVHPIDAFVEAELERAGVRHAPPADRSVLIRRVYMDLIGLPPTPAEVQAFLADSTSTAYENVVDRLLASPRFGERWARHWLDLFRYAESFGHEYDYPIPQAWQYRDYVIRAFNADVPYDQFVAEHIAGDLLPEPRRNPTEGFNESIIATGSWFLGEQTHGPVDVRQHQADRIDNQIDTMTKALLGLTVGCARCHDHKFDAISTKDYYALAGYFLSSHMQQAMLDPQRRMEAAVGQINALRTQGDAALVTAVPTFKPAPESAIARALLASQSAIGPLGNSPPPAQTTEGVLFEDFDEPNYRGWYRSGQAFGEGPMQLGQWDACHDGLRLARPGVAHSGQISPKLRGVLRSKTFELPPQVAFRVAGSGKIRLIVDGYIMDIYNDLIFKGLLTDVDNGDKFQWIVLGAYQEQYVGHRAHIEIIDDGDGWIAVDEIRFLARGTHPAPAPSVPAAAPFAKMELNTVEPLAAAYAAAIRAAIANWQVGRIDADGAALLSWATKHQLLIAGDEPAAALQALRQQIQKIAVPKPVRVLAIADGNGLDHPVFIRGSHASPGALVPRRMIEAIAGMNQPDAPTEGSGRLQLAQRMIDPANPFITRVIVNRIWQHMTGTGIVPSVDNFGVQGQRPANLPLLDHLADSFVKDGWSIKRTIRRIALSQTYRMASTTEDETAEQKDPTNSQMHRMNIRRLEGEAIRDSILAISGRLDSKMYGPSVPTHLTPFNAGRGRPKQSGPLDGAGRRSIYVEVRRNFLSSMMLAFDMPIPFQAMGRRSTTNVPAQALLMMNDPFIAQQAQLWARRALSENQQSPQDRIKALYLAAFSHPPKEAQVQQALEFLEHQGAHYGLPAEQCLQDARVWSDLCHVLLNVKEFVLIR